MCAYVGVWVGADREGIHLPLLCPPRPIHLSLLHLFSVIYPPSPCLHPCRRRSVPLTPVSGSEGWSIEGTAESTIIAGEYEMHY